MVRKTPPMGWNSWNTFGSQINEEVILRAADSLVASGLAACGYEYVVIDDCWSLPQRDAQGRLVPDPEKFPHGMKYVADYIHQKGLKFGMYSDAGPKTCAGYPGSGNHEHIDAATFASWDVDYLKYDYCYHEEMNLPGAVLYKRMGLALANCGRDILFSACSWGADDSYQWMKETGAHIWRSTGDIQDAFSSVRNLIQQEITRMEYNGQGCFNDLDMLIVGMNGEGNVAMGGCTPEEYALHFAFWCFFGSPLMIGSDLSKLDETSLRLLTNPDLIRIDQDSAYRQPFFLAPLEKNMERTTDQHYYKDYPGHAPLLARILDDGSVAIGLFNLSEQTVTDVADAGTIGVAPDCPKTLVAQDVFSGEQLPFVDGKLSITCAPHTCRVFIARLCD